MRPSSERGDSDSVLLRALPHAAASLSALEFCRGVRDLAELERGAERAPGEWAQRNARVALSIYIGTPLFDLVSAKPPPHSQRLRISEPFLRYHV